ncbi:MAG TPA: hypothetical protein VGG91_15300 [Myxococcaceae bacterium]
MVRSVVALLVITAVLVAPTVERIRAVCRTTGVEMTAHDCPDQTSAASPGLAAESCCRHQVDVPLEAGKLEHQAREIAQPLVFALQLPPAIAALPAVALAWSAAPPSRPPLSETRILLI